MTIHLTSDNTRQKEIVRLMDWLKEIGLVFSYEVQEPVEEKTATFPLSHRASNANGQFSKAAISALDKVEKLKSLQPNWDSYQADAPSPVAIASSQGFIRRADRDGMEVYFVAPGRSGEVLVEFKSSGGKAAEVYFEPTGSAEVLMYQNEECILEGPLQENYAKLTTFLNETVPAQN